MFSIAHRRKTTLALCACALLNVVACSHQEIGNMTFPEGQLQIVAHADAIQWKPCPPTLPQGCEMAVLDGHPKKPDMFTVRFRVRDNFVMRPHTHPRHERVTVLDGQVRVAFGLNAKREDAKVFNPGDYYINSRDAVHSVWVDNRAILQITGIGPWEVNFVSAP